MNNILSLYNFMMGPLQINNIINNSFTRVPPRNNKYDWDCRADVYIDKQSQNKARKAYLGIHARLVWKR